MEEIRSWPEEAGAEQRLAFARALAGAILPCQVVAVAVPWPGAEALGHYSLLADQARLPLEGGGQGILVPQEARAKVIAALFDLRRPELILIGFPVSVQPDSALIAEALAGPPPGTMLLRYDDGELMEAIGLPE